MNRLLCLFGVVGIGWGITREEVIHRATPQGDLKMTLFYPDDWKPTES